MKTVITLCALLALSMMSLTGATAAEEAKADAKANMAPLPIKTPKPIFQGTAKKISVPNLERYVEGKKRPAFLAPKGAVNLAKDLEVASSDEFPVIGELELITDGDKEGGDGSYVELGPGKQHVQIDLGEPCEIYAIVVWHYHSQRRVYHDFVVQAADDADFIENVKTLYNNDIDNSAGLGKGKDRSYIEDNQGRLIDTKGVKTQFLRFVSNGNTSNELNHYIEIEVWGKKVADLK